MVIQKSVKFVLCSIILSVIFFWSFLVIYQTFDSFKVRLGKSETDHSTMKDM